MLELKKKRLFPDIRSFQPQLFQESLLPASPRMELQVDEMEKYVYLYLYFTFLSISTKNCYVKLSFTILILLLSVKCYVVLLIFVNWDMEKIKKY